MKEFINNPFNYNHNLKINFPFCYEKINKYTIKRENKMNLMTYSCIHIIRDINHQPATRLNFLASLSIIILFIIVFLTFILYQFDFVFVV